MSSKCILSEEELHSLLVEAIKRGSVLQKVGIANGIADNMIDEISQTVIFEKEYNGFESLADIERDVYESFDPEFNEGANVLPDAPNIGTVTVLLTYKDD